MNYRRIFQKPTQALIIGSILVMSGWLAASCADGEAGLGLPPPPNDSDALSGPSDSNSASTGAGGSVAGSAGHTAAPVNDVPVATWPDGRSGSTEDTRYFLLISVDGLAARFLWQLIDEGRVPMFERLAAIGASTRNARTDTVHTNTLPNHTCMLTGLPVVAPPGFPVELGHGYTFNADAGTTVTLHNSGNPARTYTPSVFDVAHDHGLKTAMFASKTKFSVYTNSFNAAGAPDPIGEDNGTQKIDTAEIITDPPLMTTALVAKLKTNPAHFTFVHFNQPDLTGHGNGWGGEAYLSAVQAMDTELERVLDAILANRAMRGHTALVVTTDHGGTGFSHLEATNKDNFVIPFYLVGPGIPGGANLYDLAPNRQTPVGDTNPGYELQGQQPIRNGDSGNLGLELLGLPPIPNSLMNDSGIAGRKAQPAP